MKFKRPILSEANTKKTANLYDLIHLAMLSKQAHWNVVGVGFRSIHLELDEIYAAVQSGVDEVAERIAALGVAPDGRAASVAKQSRLEDLDVGFHSVAATVTSVADLMKKADAELRKAIEGLDDLDLISQDLLIGIAATLEKHLWMLQTQEVGTKG